MLDIMAYNKFGLLDHDMNFGGGAKIFSQMEAS